jgi:hypothetical protein
LSGLSVPPREAVVLYLAGEQNLDKDVMLRKGFAVRATRTRKLTGA